MDEKLERAEGQLKHADEERNIARDAEEAAREQLKVAENAEEEAIRDTERALEEIREAEEECREINFTVDGEPYDTKARDLTPDVILKDFAGRDPIQYYLVRIENGQKESYQNKGHIPIKMHDGMRFQSVYIGPTPVSDDTGSLGFRRFSQGLLDLGFDPRPVPNIADALYFDFRIETGEFAGRAIRLGFNVPPDFPNTPPSGPYISPYLRPINTTPNTPHPHGAIHEQQAKPFADKLEGQWQYWSRPFTPDWGTQKKTVATYMNHIWRLLEIQ